MASGFLFKRRRREYVVAHFNGEEGLGKSTSKLRGGPLFSFKYMEFKRSILVRTQVTKVFRFLPLKLKVCLARTFN